MKTADWGSGYTADVTIANLTTAAIDGWTIEFDIAGSISNLWNGVHLASGTHHAVTNPTWSTSIPPGGDATFGFVGSGSTPANCAFNGSPCSFE